MKEVEFYSNEIEKIGTVARKLFIDIERQDPSSAYYNEILERPEINWLDISMKAAVPSIAFMLSMVTF